MNLNIKPQFGEPEPTKRTQLQNITCDEAGITCDEAGYTCDGVSGAIGRSPTIDILNVKANIGITTITPTI